jgi:hypothetical protein
VEDVGHILAVFPTVHFSKSTFYWQHPNSDIHPQGLRPTGFDPIPTSTFSLSSLCAWDAPLADTSSSALRLSGIVRFDTFHTAPERVEA